MYKTTKIFKEHLDYMTTEIENQPNNKYMLGRFEMAKDCKNLILSGVSQQRELLKVLGKHIAEQYDHNEEDVIEQLEWKVKTFNCG